MSESSELKAKLFDCELARKFALEKENYDQYQEACLALANLGRRLHLIELQQKAERKVENEKR